MPHRWHGAPPRQAVLDAIDSARARGIRVVLVTGRILAELDAEFFGLANRFDAVCAENGAVLVRSGTVRALAPAMDRKLEKRLLDAYELGVAVSNVAAR